jgi:protein TonB
VAGAPVQEPARPLASAEQTPRAEPVVTERAAAERDDDDESRASERSERSRGDDAVSGSEPAARVSERGRPSAPPASSTAPAPPAKEGVLTLTPQSAPRADGSTRGASPSAQPASAAAPAARPAPPGPASAASAAPAVRGATRDAVVLEQVIPKFPARARRMDVSEGSVALEYTVDERGAVKDAVVVSASPPGVFDEAALSAIRRWRYQPKLQDGKPVASRKRFRFTFR